MFYLSKEKRQFIPDGEWEGFYTYILKKEEHKMNCVFTFKDGLIKGYGSDDVGAYSWSGEYDHELNVYMIKIYSKHTVKYEGCADENGIWGNWKIIRLTGVFHLWPKKQTINKAIWIEEKASEVSILKILQTQ